MKKLAAILLALCAGVASADEGATRSTVFRILEETGLTNGAGVPTGTTSSLASVLNVEAKTGGHSIEVTTGDGIAFGTGTTPVAGAIVFSSASDHLVGPNENPFRMQASSSTPGSAFFALHGSSAASTHPGNFFALYGGSGSEIGGGVPYISISLNSFTNDQADLFAGGTASALNLRTVSGDLNFYVQQSVKAAKITTEKNVVLNATGSSLAQNATSGFTYIPRCLTGAPSGTPTAYTGTGALVIGGNNHLYAELSSGAFSRIDLGTDSTPTFTGLTLAGGTVTTSTPPLSITQTWNSAGVTFSGLFFNVTNSNSQAASTLIDLQVDSSSKFNVARTGAGTFASNLTSASFNTAGSGITIASTGGITRYLSVNTAAWGVPAVYASGRSAAQSSAVPSVTTFTPTADGSFEVWANVLITTATSHTFTVTCAYTDEGSTARTATLSFYRVAGGTPDTSIVNANGAVPYMGIPMRIRVKANTAITVATTGTFGTVTYNVEASIIQIS